MATKKVNDNKALLQRIDASLKARENLNNDALLKILHLLVITLNEADKKDEPAIIQYNRILELLLSNYNLTFINEVNNAESFFISIELFIRLAKVIFN